MINTVGLVIIPSLHTYRIFLFVLFVLRFTLLSTFKYTVQYY